MVEVLVMSSVTVYFQSPSLGKVNPAWLRAWWSRLDSDHLSPVTVSF